MGSNQQYLSIPELIKSLKAKAGLIDSGELTEEEMSAMIDASRELYERLVILQYKVFEESVKGSTKQKTQEVLESEDLFSGFKLDLSEQNELKPKKKKDKPKPGKQESIPIPDQPLPFNNPNPPKSLENEKFKPVEPEPEIKDENQINLIDAISETPATLNDKMANTSETLSSKLGKSPIKDLKQAIGINQKFLFMNDLFMGEHEAYHTAIDKINACSGKEEAQSYIEDVLIPKYDWDMDDNSVEHFLSLVERRFK